MLRIVAAVAIVGLIFLRSPHRSDADLVPDPTGLLAKVQSEVAAVALRSETAKTVAEAALRRTLGEPVEHAPVHR